MRTCQSCGRENPDDRDFCECGEYLRWEPTGFVQAVTPEMAEQALEQAQPEQPAAPEEPPADTPTPAPPEPAAPEPPPHVEQAAPAPPPPDNGQQGVPKTEVRQAVPAPAPAEPAAPAGASLTLRAPDRDAFHGETLALGIEPGQREQVLALVRNQSGIVDNYELRVEGLPDDWWSIFPDTVYLVPFGSAGTYEQEVEVHLHPPRTPDAEARIWELQVVAHSKASNADAVAAPLELGIQPYTETQTKVRPERAKGRRKADFTVDVSNRANAAAVVALEGTDPDGELAFGFDRPPTEIKPGETVQTTMRVKPPKQIWLGRPVDKRFEVQTLTGDEAAERLAAEPKAADGGPPPARRRGRFRIPGVSKPQMFRPQVYEPGVSIGPGGINFRKPQFRGPQMRGPQMGAKNFQLSQLKMPGRGGAAAAAPAAPLLPSQGILRQKAWLPWWLVPVLALLIALLLLLYLLLPRNVTVPDLVGTPSAFDAEQQLTEADLRLAAGQKEEVSDEAPPGTVIGQTPAAGEKAEKDSEVSLLIAIGNGSVDVPKIVGLTLPEAEKALREKKLTPGAASPQPPDPAKKIESQIPAAGEAVKEGTPVDIFYAEPGAGGKGEKEGAGGAAGGGGGGGAGGGGGGGGGGGEVVVPAVEGAAADAYARKVADEGLLPELVRAFDASKRGTVFETEPAAGTKVEAGSTVRLLVSAGFPSLAFDNDKNILRVNGANGDPLDPVAKGPTRDKDPAFSHDGTRLAYVGAGRVLLADLAKPDAPAVPLTVEGEEYADLAWAPTSDVNVLAMGRVKGDDRDLCLGRISGQAMEPSCIVEPKIEIGSAIHWSPNGKEIYAGGVTNDATSAFGLVRWKSKRPFSANAADWGKGKFETDTSVPGQGVKEAALSPDGKRLALISNIGGGPFELLLAKPGDFALTNAKRTRVRACKITWRPDSRELAVVQADAGCRESAGALVRFPIAETGRQEQLAPNGDNPVFEPLSLDAGG